MSVFCLIGEEGAAAVLAVVHELAARGGAGVEGGHADQGLPRGGVPHQEPRGRVGVPQDGERRGQVRGLRPRLDEADPGAAARERAAQAGDGRRGAAGQTDKVTKVSK